MKTILCFGDSNTWGYDPDATAASPYPIRHAHDIRWTGVLTRELGSDFRVVEEGQNGRATVHDDPLSEARNGKLFLPACLESHKPIDLVIMMLGTNDLKNVFGVSPGEIASGATVLAKMILQSDAGLNGKAPPLLLICPPAIGDMSRVPEVADKFGNGIQKSLQLPSRYEAAARMLGCAYFNSQDVVVPSTMDGIHLAAGEHEKLGKAIAMAVKRAL